MRLPILLRSTHLLSALHAVVALLVLVGLAGADGEDRIHLVVLHTNDVHGQALPRTLGGGSEAVRQVGGLERVAEYVAEVRETHRGPRKGVLVLDGGDWFQGTPEGAIDAGLPFVTALAAVGYDAMSLGNHEFDLGLEPLRRILRESGVPAVCANLRESVGGPRVDWLEPWREVEVAGLRVGLVGFVYESTPHITHPESRALHFTDEVEELERVWEELPDDLDLVIPVTHSGTETDRRLIDARPEIPLVVGGHSHTYLRSGIRVGKSLVAQAGSKATVVGRVDLFIDPRSREVVESTARLVELERAPGEARRNARVEGLVSELVRRSDEAMGELVGEIAGPFAEMERFASSSVGNWIADSFRSGVPCDVAIHNRGGIRKRMVPGPVTRRDLFELLPFPNTLVSFELTGAELLDCMKGGLVGKETTRLEVSGARIGLRLDREQRVEEVELWVDGEPLELERTYRVATNSFLAEGGDRLFVFERDVELLDTGTLLRDLLERQLRETEGPLELPRDDRYAVLEGR